VSAEWVRNDIDAPYLGNPQLGGYHITGSWILTGEMRPYNRRNGTLGPVPVARSIDHGGYGAWELTGRYSSVDLSDGSLSGGEMDIFSLGLNWILKPTFMLNLNYRHVDLDRFGIVGKSDGLMGRVILMMD
jgi:phosphate-selective porin OprO/OprP